MPHRFQGRLERGFVLQVDGPGVSRVRQIDEHLLHRSCLPLVQAGNRRHLLDSAPQTAAPLRPVQLADLLCEVLLDGGFGYELTLLLVVYRVADGGVCLRAPRAGGHIVLALEGEQDLREVSRYLRYDRPSGSRVERDRSIGVAVQLESGVSGVELHRVADRREDVVEGEALPVLPSSRPRLQLVLQHVRRVASKPLDLVDLVAEHLPDDAPSSRQGVSEQRGGREEPQRVLHRVADLGRDPTERHVAGQHAAVDLLQNPGGIEDGPHVDSGRLGGLGASSVPEVRVVVVHLLRGAGLLLLRGEDGFLGLDGHVVEG